MSFKKVDLSLPTDFKNIVRLFPLPNLVVYPGVIQGLHIFEPRYRELMHDSMAADMLITMAVLKPHWEATANKSPAVYQTVTIGKVLTHTEQEDGSFNLLLIGASRARISNEIATSKPYRLAEVTLLDDYCDATAEKEALLRESLVTEFRKTFSLEKQLDKDSVEGLINEDLPFGILCDLICYSLGVTVPKQVEILETLETSLRAEKILDLIRKKQNGQLPDGKKIGFPPDFSMN